MRLRIGEPTAALLTTILIALTTSCATAPERQTAEPRVLWRFDADKKLLVDDRRIYVMSPGEMSRYKSGRERETHRSHLDEDRIGAGEGLRQASSPNTCFLGPPESRRIPTVF